MDSRRYAAYRRVVRDHAEELLLRRGPGLADEVEEISQSAALLLSHPTAVGLVSRGLVSEVDKAPLACAPSIAMVPETRSASSARRSPSANDSNPL